MFSILFSYLQLLLYKRLFLLLFIFSLIIVTASTSGHHDLHGTKQEEKDRHITQLTHKLQSVPKEMKESQEIITTLQTKLQEYKQQLLKTTG